MTDAFDLLGIPPTFRLDPGRLEETHRDLSSALHPDRYVGRSAAERRAALGKAIEVNAAFRQLKQPLTRGELLLARLGNTFEPSVDDDFLMEIMELREELRDAAASRDEAKIERLSAAIRARTSEVEERLGELFAQALSQQQASSPSPEISRLLSELRYFERFLIEAGALLDELF